MASDDKLLYIIVGALVGIPLGMVLFKYLFNQQSGQPAPGAAYGFNYNYDANGNLTSYTPVPLGQAPLAMTKMTAATVSASAATQDETQGLFLT